MSGESTSSLRFPDVPKLELDQLIDQLVERAEGVRRAQGRLRALLRAIETINGDLALDVVLRNVVESACELAQARYGALGVIGQDGGLEQFIHLGMDDATVERIGQLPQGKGLLGELITDPRPVRLQHIGGDPRSSGFPAGHPPMDSFLGVPIRVRDEVFGNLYLTDNARGAFTAEDEELVIALALAAGTAISNARLYQESRLQQRWLQASVEISAQMLASSGEDPLQLIARRAIDIADADLVSVSLVDADGQSAVVEVVVGAHADQLVGRAFPLADTIAGAVISDGQPLLLASVADSEGPRSHLAEVIEAGPLMVVPLSGTGLPRGVLSVLRTRGRRAFSPSDLAMAAGFATHASVALELADSRAAEQRLILLEDRDRIAMDLHDHVIQEMFAIGLSLQSIAGQLGNNERLAGRLLQKVEDIDRTIRRIRTSIFELRGAVTATSDGLRQKVLEVASDLTPALGFAPHVAFAGLLDLDLDDQLADDVLATVREALTNIAKHARASSAMVDVVLAGTELTVTVSDDGTGLDDAATRSSGISNLRARAEKWGGTLQIAPGPSRGTVLTWKARTV
jgi:signal transduction histidine kinase